MSCENVFCFPAADLAHQFFSDFLHDVIWKTFYGLNWPERKLLQVYLEFYHNFFA